ncbi:MAG: DUF1573 domain-containing protein [Planctomycetota bacterium]|nr:DUF1573 domain-containing protein [Planctomycetota bacterium]
MKTIIAYAVLASVAVLTGIGAGWGFGWWESSNTEENFFQNQWARIDSSNVAPQVSLLGSNDFQFKALKQGEPVIHDFVIKNSGTSDLEIKLEEQSDNVDVLLPDGQVVLPGRTFPVTLKLRNSNLPGEFKEFAVISTNDPSEERKQLRFSISGTLSKNGEKRP